MREQSRPRTVIVDLAEPSAERIQSDADLGLSVLADLDLVRSMGSAGTTTSPGASDEDN
jgi:hypothetical protein